jgi:PST family polysaccharide transporter
MLAYFNQNIDYLVIGRLLGPAALGVYSLAYKLVTWPVLKISHVTLRVAFPAFSRLQHDDEAMRRSYLRLIAVLALVVFPLLVGLAVLGPEAIPLIFGAKWQAAVAPTQILCLAGMIKAVNCSVGSIFMSRGRPDLELKTNLLGTLLLGGFVLGGVRWGVPGVAAAVLFAGLIGFPIQQTVANRLIRLRWASYLDAIRVALVACSALLAALAAWRFEALARGWPAGVVLAGAVPLAAVVYAAMLSLQGYDWPGLLRLIAGRGQRPAAPSSAPQSQLAG